MKIVFSMRHSGALRNFASTVEELARRGHRIHLIFEYYDVDQPEPNWIAPLRAQA